MKSILITLSLMLIVSTQVQAQDAELGIWQGQEIAPIFAQLKMSGLARNMSAVNPFINMNNGAQITFDSKQVKATLFFSINKSNTCS